MFRLRSCAYNCKPVSKLQGLQSLLREPPCLASSVSPHSTAAEVGAAHHFTQDHQDVTLSYGLAPFLLAFFLLPFSSLHLLLKGSPKN